MSREASAPNITPAGFSSHISAPGISERRRPSVWEMSPPVTRLVMLLTESGPLNVADSPLRMLNCPKL